MDFVGHNPIDIRLVCCIAVEIRLWLKVLVLASLWKVASIMIVSIVAIGCWAVVGVSIVMQVDIHDFLIVFLFVFVVTDGIQFGRRWLIFWSALHVLVENPTDSSVCTILPCMTTDLAISSSLVWFCCHDLHLRLQVMLIWASSGPRLKLPLSLLNLGFTLLQFLFKKSEFFSLRFHLSLFLLKLVVLLFECLL